MQKTSQFIAASVLLVSASTVCSHTPEHAKSSHSGHSLPHATAADQQAWGIAGQTSAVTRTIHLRMSDDMRFTPNQFTVQRGETVRIHVENAGHIMHEIVLGTTASLAAHVTTMLNTPT